MIDYVFDQLEKSLQSDWFIASCTFTVSINRFPIVMILTSVEVNISDKINRLYNDLGPWKEMFNALYHKSLFIIKKTIVETIEMTHQKMYILIGE